MNHLIYMWLNVGFPCMTSMFMCWGRAMIIQLLKKRQIKRVVGGSSNIVIKLQMWGQRGCTMNPNSIKNLHGLWSGLMRINIRDGK